MRYSVAASIGLSAAMVLVACASGEVDNGIGGAGQPGSSGGPFGNTGGFFQGNGGNSSPGLGGQQTTGGLASNGGGNGFGTGAAPSSGGSIGSASGTGGAFGNGGAQGSGGFGANTGGTRANGGNVGSGGFSTTGGNSSSCSDTPPPNGDTCQHAVQYGWCGASWLNGACANSCGTCGTGSAGRSGSGGTSSGSGGTRASGGNGSGTGGVGTSSGGTTGTGGTTVVNITGGSPGWASRYWDCCKPACGWKANVPGGSTPVASCNAQGSSLGSNYDAKNACEGGGTAFMCQNFSPWSVSDTLSYGFAAISKGDYCGRCYQLQFTGKSHNSENDQGSQALAGKTLIVQAINNGGVGSDQFDLLIPGGGVGDFDACSSSWGSSDLGERYGGFFLACQKQNSFDYAKSKSCAAAKCQSVFGSKADLLAGCNWFVNWFGAPDNPALVWKEVTCPDAITQRSGLRR